jgi:hypothetical protein
MIDLEDETASYTRRQIEILRGRKISELSPIEKLDFANAAPRPLPASKVDDAYTFKLDVKKLEAADGMTKIEAANGAELMSNIRRAVAQVSAQLKETVDPYVTKHLQERLAHLQETGKLLYAKIGPYEAKRA